MFEASKTRNKFGTIEKKIFAKGTKGIDIGCGDDKIVRWARGWDIKDGDANIVSKYIGDEKYDWVFSSHTLEHMNDPFVTIADWWSIVREGGHLVIAIPDEDLYEQGVWPSRFNPDHKWTFTMNKVQSWCPKSVNVLELISSLPNAHILRLERQDDGYDYSKKHVDQTMSRWKWRVAMAQIYFVLRKDPEYENKSYR